MISLDEPYRIERKTEMYRKSENLDKLVHTGIFLGGCSIALVAANTINNAEYYYEYNGREVYQDYTIYDVKYYVKNDNGTYEQVPDSAVERSPANWQARYTGPLLLAVGSGVCITAVGLMGAYSSS
jgi:hypothetical protein